MSGGGLAICLIGEVLEKLGAGLIVR